MILTVHARIAKLEYEENRCRLFVLRYRFKYLTYLPDVTMFAVDSSSDFILGAKALFIIIVKRKISIVKALDPSTEW